MTTATIEDATALAELVRTKEVKPIELVEAAIKRIEQVNPQLNGVVHEMYDLAREAAEGSLPEGPFTGVPFLLKDLQACYAGVRMTNGCRLTKDWIPDFDSELVKRHKRAGLIVIGKTNTPELGILCTTEPELLGRAKNAWDTDKTTGGSSGGSATMVAAGVVPMAHANDGGGSIRIPASCCGIFGLKPTRGRNPLGPAMGDVMSGLVCEHAVTRTVRDSAALLDATEGYDPGDPYCAPPKKRPYAEEVGADPGRLRIAFTTKAATGAPVHEECVKAVHDAAKLCEELGHDVSEDEPEIDGAAVTPAFMALWSAGMAGTIDALAGVVGKKATEADFEPCTWALYQMGRATTGPEYVRAVQCLQSIARQIALFMKDYDIILTPTLAEPPVTLGTFDADDKSPLYPMARAGQFVPFTPIFNGTGQPAMSVPLHWSAEGLPIGTHFVGRFGEEDTLFRLAGQLEQARPWADKRPSVFAE